MPFRSTALSCAVAVLMGGCARAPEVPAVLALPAPGTPYARFRAEESNCRDYAHAITVSDTTAANQRAVGAIVLGTVIGAAVGGGIGSAFGHAGTGALAGAGVGSDLGGDYGLGHNRDDEHSIQRAYDVAYARCMYANGNFVPGHGPPPDPVGQPPPASMPPEP
jgi:uncharacterized protein YcfJ